jgi:hypothetical protein
MHGTSKLIFAAALVASAAGLAQGTTGPAEVPEPAKEASAETPETKAARELVTKYLSAVKAKKWADAKKLQHPDTQKAIAERKKRLGQEDHPMAPWYHEKLTSWLKEYKLTGSSQGPNGTIIVETSEDNFQVQEKGVAEGDKATYLLGRVGGKWLVVDKKQGETFTRDSIKLGYKGWFDPVEKKEAPAE